MLKRELTEFKNSFKEIPKLNTLVLMLYDALFYLLIYLVAIGLSTVFAKISPNVQGMNMFALQIQDTALIEQQYSMMKKAMIYVAVYFIIFILLTILSWTISRYLVWTRLLKKNIDLKNFRKFFFLNLLWVLIWFIPYAIVTYPAIRLASQGDVFTGLLYLLAVPVFTLIPAYFTYMLYYGFLEKYGKGKSPLKTSIKHAFINGGKYFTKLIVPVILAIIVFLIIFFGSYIFKDLPEAPKMIVSFIISFGTFAWIKIYLSQQFKIHIRL